MPFCVPDPTSTRSRLAANSEEDVASAAAEAVLSNSRRERFLMAQAIVADEAQPAPAHRGPQGQVHVLGVKYTTQFKEQVCRTSSLLSASPHSQSVSTFARCRRSASSTKTVFACMSGP